MNLMADIYFLKTKEILKKQGLNPIVKYRYFTRFPGLSAMFPAIALAQKLCPEAEIKALPEGTPFEVGDTIMTIEAPAQSIVEYETQILQWAALPSYVAYNTRRILMAAEGKMVMGFHPRHMFGMESEVLSSYGAKIGGIDNFSTEVSMDCILVIEGLARSIKKDLDRQIAWERSLDCELPRKASGTTPHALVALFKGNYLEMAKAYLDTFPNDNFVALIDYNNREIDDTISLAEQLGDKLWGIRTDTCGENYAQVNPSTGEFGSFRGEQFAKERGVCPEGVNALRTFLNLIGANKTKIFVSSGFDEEKTKRFMKEAHNSFDGIGTGSFIKLPTATADIMWVDGKKECKVGREWGYQRDEKFKRIVT